MKRTISLLLVIGLGLACAGNRVVNRSPAGGGSPISFSDTFVRTNEIPLSKGGAWTSGTTGLVGMQLVSNLAASASNANGIAYVTTPSFAAYPNQSATITVSSTGGCEVCVRVNANGNHYALYITNSTTLEIYKRVSGTNTTLGSAFTVSALTAGDTITLAISGTTLTTYRNGVSQGTRTDSDIATGAPGLGSTVTTKRMGAFSCTSL